MMRVLFRFLFLSKRDISQKPHGYYLSVHLNSSQVVVLGVRTTSLPDSIRNFKYNLMLPGKMLTVLQK